MLLKTAIMPSGRSGFVEKLQTEGQHISDHADDNCRTFFCVKASSAAWLADAMRQQANSADMPVAR